MVPTNKMTHIIFEQSEPNPINLVKYQYQIHFLKQVSTLGKKGGELGIDKIIIHQNWFSGLLGKKNNKKNWHNGLNIAFCFFFFFPSLDQIIWHSWFWSNLNLYCLNTDKIIKSRSRTKQPGEVGGEKEDTWKSLGRSDASSLEASATSEGGAWSWGTAEASSATSLSRSLMHSNGPPTPLISVTVWFCGMNTHSISILGHDFFFCIKPKWVGLKDSLAEYCKARRLVTLLTSVHSYFLSHTMPLPPTTSLNLSQPSQIRCAFTFLPNFN